MTQTTQRHEPITETEARYIVMTRLQEPLDNGGKLSTLEDFSKALYQDGVVRRRYSARTLDNILKGRTYPLLTDTEGKPYRWQDVPRRQPGRTPLKGRYATVKTRLQALETQMGRVLVHIGLN